MNVDTKRKNATQRIALSIATFCLLGATTSADNIEIQTVTVGDPGNVVDTAVMTDQTTGYGSVDYVYNIGKYDVTQAQYAAFLNAKAATDTYALYSQYAAADFQDGIVRSGSSGSYTYSVDPSYANKPAVDVSWYDAIRFVNWLSNGQGNGDTETGTYTITNPTYYPSLNLMEWTVAIPTAAQRAAWAATGSIHWLLPSEDEFYKAAYYKGGGTNAGYWAFPTQTNVSPTSEPPPGGSNSMNIGNQYTGYALTKATAYNPSQVYLTDVGAYGLVLSAYGTFDQGDDAKQWTDTFVTPQAPVATLTGNDYVVRGGDWSYDLGPESSARGWNDADEQDSLTGFRVANVGTVPEPCSVTLLVFAAIAFLVRPALRWLRCRAKQPMWRFVRSSRGATHAVLKAASKIFPFVWQIWACRAEKCHSSHSRRFESLEPLALARLR